MSLCSRFFIHCLLFAVQGSQIHFRLQFYSELHRLCKQKGEESLCRGLLYSFSELLFEILQ